MAMQCTHLDQIQQVTPSANGCEDCLKTCGSALNAGMSGVVTHRKTSTRQNIFMRQTTRSSNRFSLAKIGVGATLTR